MIRHLFIAAILLGFPVSAFAQPLSPGIAAAPAGGFGAGFRGPIGPISPVAGAPRFAHGGVKGGFCPTIPTQPGFPFSGVWGVYGFGGYNPYGFAPASNFSFGPPVYQSQPVELRAAPNIALVNEFPAVLTLEFPAAAEVWVNGKKGEGDPTTEWTLTSPDLLKGTEYTFEVKARWTVGGKTFEYQRSIKVEGGNRSRALVVAGTEIKE